MATKTRKRRIVFSIESEPGRVVSIAGSFNGWDTKKKQLNDKLNNGIYQGIMMLEPGTYEYKFYIDGTWCIDPNNSNFAPNEMGTLNSVLVVE